MAWPLPPPGAVGGDDPGPGPAAMSAVPSLGAVVDHHHLVDQGNAPTGRRSGRTTIACDDGTDGGRLVAGRDAHGDPPVPLGLGQHGGDRNGRGSNGRCPLRGSARRHGAIIPHRNPWRESGGARPLTVR